MGSNGKMRFVGGFRHLTSGTLDKIQTETAVGQRDME